MFLDYEKFRKIFAKKKTNLDPMKMCPPLNLRTLRWASAANPLFGARLDDMMTAGVSI